MSTKQKGCNCIDELSPKILELLKEKFKPNIITENDGLNVTFGFDKSRTYSEYSYKNTTVKNDGSTGATYKREHIIVHTFCPFCGKPYSKKDGMLPIEPDL